MVALHDSLVVGVLVYHLETGALKTTFDVKALNIIAAVEDTLVAAKRLCELVESLDDAQAEFLALLVLGNCNVFNMANRTELADAVCG